MFSIPYALSRDIFVRKPASEIFAVVTDLNQMGSWSPWDLMDPNQSVNISGQIGQPGHSLRWKGRVSGEGTQTLTQIVAPSRAEFDLAFEKPMRSKAKVRLLLKPEGDGTRVTWTMDSSLPVFLFFLKKMLVAMLGNDYKRGLLLLKDRMEKGSSQCKLDIKESNHFEGFYGIGQRYTCRFSELAKHMSERYEAFAKAAAPLNPQMWICRYDKTDITNDFVDYTVACAWDKKPEIQLPEGFLEFQVPAHQGIRIDIEAPYHHLGNAWSAGYNTAFALKIKRNKKIPEYEIYMRMPDEKTGTLPLTRVVLPTR